MIYCSKDRTPITLMWPDRRIYEEIPTFLPTGKYVFYTDSLNFDPSYKPIVVKKLTNMGKDISTKEGFLDVLIFTRNLTLSSEYKEMLLSLDDNSFWKFSKILCVATVPKTELTTKKPSEAYQLFEHIFKGYGRTFEVYRRMKVSHRSAISSLTSMFCSCLLTDEELKAKYTTWFLSVTRENRKYFTHFQKCLLNYLQSKRREVDFLSFLVEIFPY